jgi:two-component system sensor histidine kinase UhpB
LHKVTKKIKKPDGLIIFKRKFVFQNEIRDKRIVALTNANKELIFKNKVHEKCAAELINANKKLSLKKEVGEKRAAELVIANKELRFQNKEKEKRAAELVIANKELRFQNKEKEKRAAELVIANKELRFQNKEKGKRAAELVIANNDFRKTAAALQQSLHEVSDYKYALDESSDVTITDQKGIIIYANENFCKISQYTAKELIGQDHRITNSGYHPASFMKKLWVTIAHGRIWHGDFRNKAKDGSIYWEDTTVVPFLDQKGKPYQYLAIRKDISKRKKAEEELQTAHDRLVFHIDNAPLGFIEWDNQIRPKIWSKRAEEIFGWTEKEIISGQVDWYTRVYEEDQPWVAKISEQLISGKLEKNHLLHRNYTRDGRVIWCEWFNSVLKDENGKILSILSLVQDITERKNAEQELLQNQMRLNQSQATAHLGSWEINFETNTSRWSDEAYRIYGFTPGDHNLLVSDWMSFVHPGDLHYVKNLVDWSQKAFSDIAFHHRIVRKDGTVRHIYSEAKFEFNDKGQPSGLYGIAHDVTESKKAEEKIRESNRRYEFVNKATQDTIWEWDYRTKKGKWGEGIMTTFGYSEDKLNYGENWMDEFVHPDDKERILKEIQGRIKHSLQNCQNEYRFRCANGTYKYVFDRGYILYDENKEPQRMIGAMTDLTEKKRMEKELAAQQIRQQKLITETTIEVQEKEKNELGRELHDNINQILATVKMYLGMAKAKENVSVDLVGQSYEYVSQAILEIRKLSHSLVAPSLGDIDLKEALKELVENAKLFNDLQVKLVFDEKYNEKNIDKRKELTLYRIVQEEINNIIKHAKANKVVVSLKTDNGNIFLSVADDGVGFDVKQKSQGIGLKNISSRVKFYSGNMNIISVPGQGCTLEISIPC